jgi:hypothetical protein
VYDAALITLHEVFTVFIFAIHRISTLNCLSIHFHPLDELPPHFSSAELSILLKRARIVKNSKTYKYYKRFL